MRHLGEFTIKSRLPSLNEIRNSDRGNYNHANQEKRNAQDLIRYYIQTGIHSGDLKSRYTEPVVLYIDWYEPNNRRDADNVKAGGTKLILDALVKAGVLEDDSPKYVRDVIGWVHYPRYDNPTKKEQVVVTVMGLETEVNT